MPAGRPKGSPDSHLRAALNSEQPALALAWKSALQLGIASELCDRIVMTRDVPDRLADVLCHALAQEGSLYEHQNALSQRQVARRRAA